MTQYVYLDTMQNLCLRLNNAFKVTRPDDQPLTENDAAYKLRESEVEKRTTA